MTHTSRSIDLTANAQPTLSYHAQQFRVRVELSRAHAKHSPTPPAELFKKAQAKMNAILASGKVLFFETYEDKLSVIWEKLHKDNGLHDAFALSFTLAAGAPALPDLDIERGPNEKAALLVSFKPSAQSKTWLKEWIRTTIVHKAKEFGIEEPLFMAQVQACINRIQAGESLDRYAVALKKCFPLGDLGDKAFGILTNKSRGEISVVINDLAAFKDAKTFESLHRAIIFSADKLKQSSPGQYKYYRQDILECLETARKGPESLGVGTPLVILAVMGFYPQVANSPTHYTGTSSANVNGSEVGALPTGDKDSEWFRYLYFTLSDDLMQATIQGFKKELYNHQQLKFGREWLEELLRERGIVGLTDDLWNRIEDAWGARENLDGLVVAEGVAPLPGADPYLHPTYKDAPKEDGDKVVNMREAQQRLIVQAGSVVAEVRFKKPNVPGRNVLGKAVTGPLPELHVKIGVGIRQTQSGKFVATTDGLPVIEDDSISVSQVYVHSGDVDMKSGNIHFDGPVEIKGSIDSGATVQVKGPLIVHGMIRSALVYSQEGIDVKEGIVTTQKGSVRSKGNISADFIENSQVFSEGSLTVKKALVNSSVYVMGSIFVADDDGIVGGGLVSCRDVLVANNIGFPSGARTKLVLGTDVRALHRVKMRESRLHKLKEADESYRLELREIAGKREAQLTKKHKERKEILQAMLGKVKAIIEKAEAALSIAKHKVSYNSAALMVAHKRLSVNCDIEIAGQGVRIAAEMLAIAVAGRKRRDSHFCTAEEVKSEIEKALSNLVATETKKAS